MLRRRRRRFLEWVLYVENANPFMDIAWDAAREQATFTSTSEVRITVNALAPWWRTAVPDS
ncbi:hypothetical protein ACL02R_13890 [Streptomyces sp. MS19]|uniref:hypothetical protein n=1 Tax=Streptomyces sp. MS19 TaxID=3385972 RepID=UPI00399EFD80